jgi:citronellol/citronellal dehydrogenase
MTTLKGRTLFISGASRGIGLAIALRAARDGANVAIAAKTAEPHPKLEGTIYTAAKEIEAAGGKALPLICDIREEAQVEKAVDETVKKFGGIDVCVNNASAISLTPSTQTDMKRYDLMHGINARGTFLVSRNCIPHLKKSSNPHILMLSPPLDMWPRTTIATAAVRNLLGGDELMRRSRTPEIMGDAAHIILTKDAKTFTGNFCIDDTLLAEHGVTDFEKYRVDKSVDLAPDFFVPASYKAPPGVKLADRMR